MHAALNMPCQVNYQAVCVYGQLCLNGVPLSLAAVMRLAFTLVLWPGNLLLRRVQESFQLREHRRDFFQRLQSPDLVVQLPRRWQNVFDEGFKFSYVFEHVALVKVEKNPCKGGCYVEPVVEKKHQEPLLELQLERVSGAYFAFPVCSGKPLGLVLVIVGQHFGVE